MQEIKITDKNYPESLKHIQNPPKKLFVRGEILLEDKTAIAIVGARKHTSYGKQVAYDFAYTLAKSGVTIVSGLALGIDSEAHKGALDAGGRTLAVLGSGIDDNSIYPYSHKSLAERIIKNGALISEYEPGTPGLKHHFPERNRIVAGLSVGILIVEAQKRSGSLITAKLALEQGKDIFAIPGPIFSKMSEGTNKLIQQGAKLAMTPNDILEELEIAGVKIKKESKQLELSEQEKKIYEILKNEILDTDGIIKKSKMQANEVLVILTMLELKNVIKNMGNDTYGIA